MEPLALSPKEAARFLSLSKRTLSGLHPVWLTPA
jgi:hypothetical protein